MGDRKPTVDPLAQLSGSNNGVRVIGGSKLKRTIDPITKKVYGEMSKLELIRLCVLLTDTCHRFATENVQLRKKVQDEELPEKSEGGKPVSGKRTTGINF